MTSRVLAPLASVVLFALTSGCASASEESTDRPSEIVVPPRPIASVPLAMLRDGDSIYLASAAQLDRIDARTGELTHVAGPEWAACPREPRIVWMSTAFDFTYPSLTIRGTTAYLVHPDCGLWSFDFTTKKAQMLVDPSSDAKVAVAKATGHYAVGAIWNGKMGSDWSSAWGMAIASDGDGLVGCFPAFATEPDADAPSAVGYRYRIELWSIATDGTPRELLAFIPRGREREDGEDYCKQVIPEEDSLLVSTDKALLRWDRRTRQLTTIVGGFRHGADGVATDATDIYFVKDNALVKVPRMGGPTVTLRASSGTPDEPTRLLAALDGDFVYFNESYTLKRMRKDGRDLIDFATGNSDDWVMPMVVGIGAEHIYFERITKAPPGTDPETGEQYNPAFMGTMRRARK